MEVKTARTDGGVSVAKLVYTGEGWVMVPLDNPKHVRLRMTDDERAALTLSGGEAAAMDVRLDELEKRALLAGNGSLF